MGAIYAFFVDNFPSPIAICIGGPLGLFWAYVCLYFSGYLKKTKGLQTGYTRKIFHFMIFMTVALIHIVWGLPIVCLFGGMTSLVLFYAVLRGTDHILYEAMAREEDEPHRTLFIVVPYFATLIGGVTSNLLFEEVAVIGYLVTGFGDAIGELVGTRFGKHRYEIPAVGGVKPTRSYEGSAAVLMSCIVAIFVGILLCPKLGLTPKSLVLVPVFAILCAIVEAISPRGTDNAILQILPSFLATHFLR
jgi:phytol kinase